jgi:peptidoglycan/LPS O-acetylase OafA/YrhL
VVNASTLHFLWLRLARWASTWSRCISPPLWIIFTLNVGHVPAQNVDQLTATGYVRQIFLAQLWFQPYFDGSSWDGAAWSISAGGSAYLMFGLLALVVFRVARATRRSRRVAGGRGLAASGDVVAGNRTLLHPWSWLRASSCSSAGALACAAVQACRATVAAGAGARTRLGRRHRRHPVLVRRASATRRHRQRVVDVLFVPSSSRWPWARARCRLLSTRLLVYAGQVSFSLYMVPRLVHTSWNWVAQQFDDRAAGCGQMDRRQLVGGEHGGGHGALPLRGGAGPTRWMRRMVDIRKRRQPRACSTRRADGPPISPFDRATTTESVAARAG